MRGDGFRAAAPDRSPAALFAGVLAALLGAAPARAAAAAPDASVAPVDGGAGDEGGHADVVGGAASPAAPGHAEDAPGDVEPPRLRTFVEAAYPPDARAQGREGVVVLRLEIAASGAVVDAAVAESASPDLDEAAREAALRFQFTPARRATVAVASRILYRYQFRLSPEGSAPSPAKPPTSAVHHARGDTGAKPARASEAPLEVTVRGLGSAERRRQSSESVTVVETANAGRETADLAEVMARTQGVGVRREGGLGSATRFSLNGLTNDQIRFFIDGVPLELAGFPFGLANVPVNFIDRVEIHSGVVPIRLGADALGGAVDLVTNRDLSGTHAGASYQAGSFETHRLAVEARHRDDGTGLFLRLTGFLDQARNDYRVDVQVPDEQGRLSPARIQRFHDGYRALGANAELGFADRPGRAHTGDRLVLRGFVTDYDKQYQHNLVMAVPYGGVTYGETSAGASLRYQESWSSGWSLDAVAGYAYTRGHFWDAATCVYDWFGRCARERQQPGETDDRPHDQLSWDHSGFGRLNVAWTPRAGHTVRLAVAPTALSRTGDERLQSTPTARDPLGAERRLVSLVNGVEYQTDLAGGRWENVAFVKQYVQLLSSEEPRPAGLFRRRDRDTHLLGAGNGLRLRLTPWAYVKLSYERSVRLPRADEVFGDNAFVVANLELGPESSHNVNVGGTVDLRETRAGAFRATANGFLRQADHLIVLLGTDLVQSYQNVFAARSLGVEGAAGWTSRRGWLSLDGNATWQEFRNRSANGTFGDFAGDRIPNRPYLFANGSARLRLTGVLVPRDEVWLLWTTRYVHRYFRGWESIGLTAFKQVIPTQIIHSVGAGYAVRNDRTTLTFTVEAQNLTDAAAFDFYSVQRPGRALYFKTTAAF